MNTSGLLQSKFGLHLNFARAPSVHDSMNRSKIEFIFTFYCKSLKYKNHFNLEIKTVLYLKSNRNLVILLECRTEKQNSQLEHRQPMEQKRSLFCMCDLGVASCKSQHQFLFWRMSSMFEGYCTVK